MGGKPRKVGWGVELTHIGAGLLSRVGRTEGGGHSLKEFRRRGGFRNKHNHKGEEG